MQSVRCSLNINVLLKDDNSTSTAELEVFLEQMMEHLYNKNLYLRIIQVRNVFTVTYED